MDRGVAFVADLPPKSSADLVLPGWLTPAQQATLCRSPSATTHAHGDDLLGIVLTGSAGP